MEINQQSLNSFDEWKNFLSKNVNIAKNAGASESTVVDVATRMGDFLSNKVDPANREQRLLKEMWENGDDSDKRVIAKVVTKMVSDGTVH